MNIRTWRLDDELGRARYEAHLTHLGGEELVVTLGHQHTARARLQSTLSRDQQAQLLLYADAVADAAGVREEAAVRTALCFGVAVGAALARVPDAESEAVEALAVAIADATLGADLPALVADAVARAALDGLQRGLYRFDPTTQSTPSLGCQVPRNPP